MNNSREIELSEFTSNLNINNEPMDTEARVGSRECAICHETNDGEWFIPSCDPRHLIHKECFFKWLVSQPIPFDGIHYTCVHCRTSQVIPESERPPIATEPVRFNFPPAPPFNPPPFNPLLRNRPLPTYTRSLIFPDSFFNDDPPVTLNASTNNSAAVPVDSESDEDDEDYFIPRLFGEEPAPVANANVPPVPSNQPLVDRIYNHFFNNAVPAPPANNALPPANNNAPPAVAPVQPRRQRAQRNQDRRPRSDQRAIPEEQKCPECTHPIYRNRKQIGGFCIRHFTLKSTQEAREQKEKIREHNRRNTTVCKARQQSAKQLNEQLDKYEKGKDESAQAEADYAASIERARTIFNEQ